MSNPETTLVWHPLQAKLKDLRALCLVNEQLAPHWFRVEERSQGGFPDLWWGWGTSGLIELKFRSDVPKGADTPCVIKSISPKQRLFWRQASEAGANIHVMTRVANEWFLHDGRWARSELGNVPIAEMRARNLLRWDEDKVPTLPTASVILRLCGANP